MSDIFRTLALVTAALLLGIACSSEKPAQMADKSQAQPAEPATKELKPKREAAANAEPEAKPQGRAAPTKVEPVGKPGPAYFAVNGTGLVKLEKGGEFSLVGEEAEMVKDFAQDKGRLYFASSRGVFLVENDELKQIGDFKSPGLVDTIAVDDNGNVWATSFKGVSHFDGKKWTTQDKIELGSDVKLLADVAIADDGTVWVASSNTLHKKNAGGWETVELPENSGKLFLKSFAKSIAGELYLTHSSGVLEVGKDSVKKLELPGLGYGVDHIGVGPDGAVHLATNDSVALARGGQVTKFSAQSGHFEGKRVMALDVDGRGRTWAATDHGVVIIDPSGDVTKWAPGMIPALKGTVHALTVLGTGPELPKIGPQKFGGVTGKIIKDGKPRSGVEVEICARPSMMFRKTPCDEAPFKASAQTGPKGRFTFEKVPLGTYRFAIKPGDKWTITLSDCCSKMKEGEVFDVGSLDLAK